MRTMSVLVLAAGTSCKGCGRTGSLLCGPCARAAAPAPDFLLGGVDRSRARWAYEGAPRSLILELKARASRAAARPLADGLIELIRRYGTKAVTVTWVPGRPDGNRERGFDHAELIARCVAAGVGLPAVELLARRRDSADQSGLSRDQRRANLRGAFSSKPIEGWVLLVDDVVTSGASVEACAVALRSAGCKGVEVLTACRA